MSNEALEEVFYEAESTTSYVGELSEQSCTLLRDISEDYFGNGITEDKVTKVQMEWNRINNYVRIVANLQGLIIKQCNQLESAIEKALNERSKANVPEK